MVGIYSEKSFVVRTAAVFILLLCVAMPLPAEVLTLDPFAYASKTAAQNTWKSSPLSPPVALAPDGKGVVFPCPFTRDLQRVYWDKIVSLDLSRCTSLEIDLSCDQPDAFKSFNIYLKSGDGWYIWSSSLPEAGRQTLLVLKGDFQTEGKPAGWNHIELIRVSAWRSASVDTSVTLYSLQARSDSILLVRSTSSTARPEERAFGSRVNQRLSHWLASIGVPHGIVTDDEVAGGALSGARVAVLSYNPHPPPLELEALRRFVQHGGKLIVFYASDLGLADLMHVRLTSYQRTDLPGHWSSFRFQDAASWMIPERIYQESFNVTPIFPADNSGKVIAYWEDANGKRLDDPAWVATEQGLWMSHVLLDDDGQNKRLMLLGLLGRYDPSVWAAAAKSRIMRVGKIDSFKSLEETTSAIRADLKRAADPAQVEQLLNASSALYARIIDFNNQGHYPQAIDACRELRGKLVEAYALVQPSAAHEFRGVWDHDGTGWYPGNWNRTCEELAQQGINAIFPNLLWGGLAHYPSHVLPESGTAKRLGDQVAQCVQAAHRNGLQVHVWKVCWNLSGAPTNLVEKMRKEGRLQVTSAGKTIPWLCPSDPRNVALEINSLKEVAGNYAVDGIHLDYIRFASSDVCYCPTCRTAFEMSLRRPAKGWPQSVKPGGRLYDEFRAWRAAEITDVVRQIREHLQEVNPAVKLSAAVWGNYPTCVESVGQDWPLWLRKGYVDFVCPMNYTVDASRFAALTRSQLDLPVPRGRVYPGIGVTADESQLRPDQVIEQISMLRRLGAHGFMLFDLSYTLREETLPILRLGITRPD